MEVTEEKLVEGDAVCTKGRDQPKGEEWHPPPPERETQTKSRGGERLSTKSDGEGQGRKGDPEQPQHHPIL